MGLLKNWLASFTEKLNPAQPSIRDEQGDSQGTESVTRGHVKAFDDVEVVRRGVDMIINGAASFDYSVAEKIQGVSPIGPTMRQVKLKALLNFQPNLFQDVNKFRRLIFTDLVLEGNAFIYFDGAHMFHLPAANVEILPDKKFYVKGYRYSSMTDFTPDEVIHISDNSSGSIYRGTSRLKSSTNSLETREKMTKFQQNFFKNGAVPGLVLKSPNVLGDRIKQRLIESWMREYSPSRGGKRPMVLDGGLEVDSLAKVNFKELDFEASVAAKDDDILMALGVPAILLKGGNNANISPNIRLFYLETVLPLVRMVNAGFERYFGYNLEPEVSKVSALQPDMAESSGYFTSLVNGGVITPNEARQELRFEKIEGHDDLRIPANIAGSASDPSQGGRPEEGDE